MSEQLLKTKEALLEAALPHVVFDGWSTATLAEAALDAGISPEDAQAAYPRGGVDLAIAFHKVGDAMMLERLAAADMSNLRFRDKIAAAVRYRIEAVTDKDAVRKGSALFALPQNAADGSKLVWGTCDAIWNALGDTSDDVNWYTKRATLSGVYASTVLYWLGDNGEGNAATWEFLDRRIDNVMQIEKFKASVRKNPILSKLMAGPAKVLSGIRAPHSAGNRDDLPGHWSPKDVT
ncbi:COQ9 family protein [Falsihalocynthiibacter arcticus]|uniref:Ubiquinone biosynthesis protein n=1 Tax=Falsihalocynthiibacter arcticus TaxID=1579316 RepID=A0A126UZ09_9RHOB|nr:COQ9 family protein [Falsihalocynthiibacter arcticus]AML51298.1 ubiquinone biosynthesis protein [Falsihalocynthiibacter arcticus]